MKTTLTVLALARTTYIPPPSAPLGDDVAGLYVVPNVRDRAPGVKQRLPVRLPTHAHSIIDHLATLGWSGVDPEGQLQIILVVCADLHQRFLSESQGSSL